ncbi:SCO4225 family membrane protein [Streptomyces albicerus]|uniref:SCO4225 family membrane protein n=1 Tax=Streptomyces albicerus TaxID=2569859 RepID=UPI00124B8026|nr:hypothetical protein [Streptomyces albicerus]
MNVRPKRTLVRLMFANPASAAYLGLVGASVAVAASEPLWSEHGGNSLIWVWPALLTFPASGSLAAVAAVWSVEETPAWFLVGGITASALVQSLALGALLETLRDRRRDRRPPLARPHGG